MKNMSKEYLDDFSEDELRERYSTDLSVDYSATSRLVRFGAVWANLPRLVRVDGVRVIDLGCGDAGFLSYSTRNKMHIERYLGVEKRSKLRASIQTNQTETEATVVSSIGDAPRNETFNLLLGLGLISYQLTDNSDHDTSRYLELLRGACSLLEPESRIFPTLRTQKGVTDKAGRKYLVSHPEQVCDELRATLYRSIEIFEQETLLILDLKQTYSN